MNLDYGPLASDDERSALRRLLHRAFAAGDTEESISDWTELPGAERRRALVDGRLAGGLFRIPMGQCSAGARCGRWASPASAWIRPRADAASRAR